MFFATAYWKERIGIPSAVRICLYSRVRTANRQCQYLKSAASATGGHRATLKEGPEMTTRDNYWTKPRFGRRRFMGSATAAGVGAAALGLVGCGDDDDDDSKNSDTPGATTTTSSGGSPTAAPSSSAGKPKKGGINVAQSAMAYDSIDPHRTVASPAIQVLTRAMSKLLYFKNPNTGEVAGDLAEKWETPDAKTVTLTIRKGVKWQSKGPGASNPAAKPGRDFTVDDVIYNIERQKAGLLSDGSKATFGRKSYWSGVDKVEAVDDSHLKMTLTKPNAAFVQGLANEFNLIVQKELIEATEGKAAEISADKVIGTGPYILTEWAPGKSISAVQNTEYFLKDQPYLEATHWVQTFADPTAYRIAFEQKQIDSFSDPDPDVVTSLHDSNKDATYTRYSGVANTVAIYLPATQAPWNDPRLIKAVNLAADRRQLIQQLHNGLGKVSGPVSWLQEKWAIPQADLDKTPGYRAKKDEDLAEAKKLWDAANGSSLGEITWVTADIWTGRAAWGATPDIITSMFNKAFGTDQFKSRVAGYAEIIPAWNSKKFEPFFGWIPNVEIPDARGDMVAAFNSTSPGNIWGVSEPEKIDAKLSRALETLDDKEALKLVREVQDLALENGQYGRIIMYNYISPSLYWNYLHTTGPAPDAGWNFLANGVATLDDWIDPDDASYKGRATPQVKTL